MRVFELRPDYSTVEEVRTEVRNNPYEILRSLKDYDDMEAWDTATLFCRGQELSSDERRRLGLSETARVVEGSIFRATTYNPEPNHYVIGLIQ